MFEDEDWNINEDDLKDFNSDDIFKDNNGQAQVSSPTENVETKKKTSVTLDTSKLKSNVSESSQKNESISQKKVLLNIFNNSSSSQEVSRNVQEPTNLGNEQELKCNVPDSSQKNESIYQKKVLLDIFKNSSSSQEVSRNVQEPTNLENEQLLECTSNNANESRKNLILNVFQKSNARPIVKSVLKISDENKFKRKKNVAFSDESPAESNVAKKLCHEKVRNPQEGIKSDEQGNEISSEESSSSSKGNESNCKKQVLKSLLHKTNKVPRVKQAVVRMFPGPAGILPDDVGENDVIDLDSLDDKKKDKSNQYADICSQNTRNLFTTGAWQLMTDDLPADLELCDIATIKENALQYGKTYKKVPYLAGVIQYIDYRPNDPHIILKDISGKVDARIHHSICKLYPNALGTSIVILVKDVGIIVTSKKFVCVIISLNNLVSVYSDEERLVETPHLKTLLKDDGSNQGLNESQLSVLDESGDQGNNVIKETKNYQQQPRSILKDKGNVEKLKENKGLPESRIIGRDADERKSDAVRAEPETTNYNCDVQEFEFDENDSWLGVDINESNAFKTHQFPTSTPMDSNENNSNVLFQNKKFKKGNPEESQHLPQSGKIVPSTRLTISPNNTRKTISDKLLAFRNPNDMTRQPTISKQIGLSENGSSVTSKPFQSQDNDTDDEMLSQLDVDAITASYSTQNR